jgi:hypothetical protein
MDRVTITGADDNTPVSALLDLSVEFPFVEWGILVSRRQEGGFRFPSRKWCSAFARISEQTVPVSMHVCGEWVRQLLRGKLDWDALPEIRIVADRVQINTHAEEHISTVAAFDWMAVRNNKQFIIQLDGVNDHLFDAALARNLDVTGLFDCSHGAGVLPTEWPAPRYQSVYHGYAGGLGPENVRDQIYKIGKAHDRALKGGWWIDMEGRVRDDSERLDLRKVRQVLEICAPIVKQSVQTIGG